MCHFVFFFFFSSRRRHTRFDCDWSSDVCSSDLAVLYDAVTQRIFTFNGDAHSATVIDAVSGKRIGHIDLGAGPEFGVSAGEGTLTLVHEDAPGRFTPVATVATKRGARTMELDLKSHRVFTATADFGPLPAATPERPRPRPPVLPGTFALLILDP